MSINVFCLDHNVPNELTVQKGERVIWAHVHNFDNDHDVFKIPMDNKGMATIVKKNKEVGLVPWTKLEYIDETGEDDSFE